MQLTLTSVLAILTGWAAAVPDSQSVIASTVRNEQTNDTITPEVFAELEELARLVDISYCVGTTGITQPFLCLSRCDEFPDFELVTTWNTGPYMSDSSGYIALDHRETDPRLVVAFRGTYSIAETVADLSTIPQKYECYQGEASDEDSDKCGPNNNITVHSGFYSAWKHAREVILPSVESALASHPTYRLALVGHSLGGAIALLAGLELRVRLAQNLSVTTFGEPRVGNAAFAAHVDAVFSQPEQGLTYRRVTHVDDPVPLLPPTEFSYRPHGHELYISRPSVPPEPTDVRICVGDADKRCIAGRDDERCIADEDDSPPALRRDDKDLASETTLSDAHCQDEAHLDEWTIPSRFRLWELFFAHRDYFWRIGLCAKAGPWDWKKPWDKFAPDQEEEDL